MKRIEFLAPVEAMRGNLSGAQNLKYPTQNNKAFESPEGSVNYARNYSTRFIGAKRASDGMKYFSVKTKTATHITRKSLQAMALLGGVGAIYAAIVRVKNNSLYGELLEQYLRLTETGMQKTFRKWLSEHLRQMLVAKEQSHVITGPAGSVTIYNPWNKPSDIASEHMYRLPQISSTAKLRFWAQLGPDGSFIMHVTDEAGNKLDIALTSKKTFAEQSGVALYQYNANAGILRADNGEYVRAMIGDDLSAGNYLYTKASVEDEWVAVPVSDSPNSGDLYTFMTTAPE